MSSGKPSHLLDTSGFNQLARTRDAYVLYNRNDRYLGRSIEVYGEFSVQEQQVLTQLCAPGDTVIEAGANIGMHTIALSRRVGPGGRVLAYEPQRPVFQLLCANLALNSLANVHAFQAALGSRREEMRIPYLDPSSPRNFGGLSIQRHSNVSEDVECRRLDDLPGSVRPTLMKIDVEGMEQEVLSGGERLVRECRPVLYFENDRADQSESLLRMLDAWGYELYWHITPLFNPANHFGEAENIFGGIGSFNVIGVHRDNRRYHIAEEPIRDFAWHPRPIQR